MIWVTRPQCGYLTRGSPCVNCVMTSSTFWYDDITAGPVARWSVVPAPVTRLLSNIASVRWSGSVMNVVMCSEKVSFSFLKLRVFLQFSFVCRSIFCVPYSYIVQYIPKMLLLLVTFSYDNHNTNLVTHNLYSLKTGSRVTSA